MDGWDNVGVAAGASAGTSLCSPPFRQGSWCRTAAECDGRLVEWWMFLSVRRSAQGFCSVEFGSLDCDHMIKKQLLFGQNFLKG